MQALGTGVSQSVHQHYAACVPAVAGGGVGGGAVAAVRGGGPPGGSVCARMPAAEAFSASSCSCSSRSVGFFTGTGGSPLCARPQQSQQELRRRSERGSSSAAVAPRAAAATDQATESSCQFPLGNGGELKVRAVGAKNGARGFVEFQVLNYGDAGALVLHWGATAWGSQRWLLPGRRPDGTREYKGTALQTPFGKRGDDGAPFLKVEVDDAAVDAIEFLVVDEDKKWWLKHNGGNFRVAVPKGREQAVVDVSGVVVPEDLVQVQAYLRWERKGKQSYSPEQEKAEYEEARKELQTEVARGVSVDAIRARVSGGGGGNGSAAAAGKNGSSHGPPAAKEEEKDFSGISVPEELVQVQAYIRWERNGKQNYSPEQEKVEYEAARRELQQEVARGVSLDALQRKLQSGGGGDDGSSASVSGGSGKASSNGASAKAAGSGRSAIKRKSRDVSEIITRLVVPSSSAAGGGAAPAAPPPPRQPSPLELAAGILEGADQGAVILRKVFKFGDQELLVLVTNPDDAVKVRLASNIKEPIHLHWGLSRNHQREWLAPPATVVPPDSKLSDGSCETPFKAGFAGDDSLQSLEIPVGDPTYIGMPFVFRVGGNWYKDNGSDFYVSLQSAKAKAAKAVGGGEGTAKSFLEDVANMESEAERSLMHRYNIAVGFAERAKNEGELALAGLLVWLRFMATRQLTWNKNYNVKPREISAAQDKLTSLLQSIYAEQPHHREIVRMIMATVGRGGQGDVGQRIRDEILVIQRNNSCSGGMMEEWHQKLHNNTSPDDVVICQALLDYIQNGFRMEVYWKTLTDNGITKERLRSYDRPIVSEPDLKPSQKDGLIRDLTAYMRTLKAVHSGADLESAIETCMGYKAEGKGFMGGVEIHPIGGLSPDLPGLLQFILEHVEDTQTLPLIEALLEARRELWPTLQKRHDRLRDIIFLDLALDSTVRTAVERGLENFRKASPSDLIVVINSVLENLCLSLSDNEELVFCLKDWYQVLNLCKSGADGWALRAKAVLDRTRLILADKAEHYGKVLQPSAEYLGALLGVEEWAIDIFTEEMIRAGSAASLSQLLNQLDPVLRNIAHLGNWQVISPVEVRGTIVVVDELGEVEDQRYSKPTVLVAGRVKGEEEIPDGAVAVLTPDMPDVLSHVSVRARNGKVCFATCFDSDVLADLRKRNGKAISIELKGGNLVYNEISEADVSKQGGGAAGGEAPPPNIVLKKKQFAGKYAVSADQFTPDLVGAKSRNIANLRGKLPSWVRLPTSVALPFGTFEKVLSDDINSEVAKELAAVNAKLQKGDFHRLKEAREICLKLKAPPKLVEELKTTLKGSNMPWPGDEGEARWEQAWTAIKKVWGSKWNERAYFSTRKAGIDHSDLCMAVLVQEIIQADYAFVIHTTNPQNGDASEIYAEVVKGLGETLVGAYSGRALSFVTKKSDLKAPKVLGYPSKRVGLFIKQSAIFRSDSNGEDLEGYAGAGLYDSVPMDHEEERAVDYSTDHLLLDPEFQKTILVKIAEAGSAIEKLLGSPQDVEGVIKNGELYVVQTRPQM